MVEDAQPLDEALIAGGDDREAGEGVPAGPDEARGKGLVAEE